MSRLSPVLKNLINAPSAHPHVVPAPQNIVSVYKSLACDASSRGVGVRAWACIAAGTTITLNSPDAFRQLYNVASSHWDSVKTAELMREVGLKSIAFNGIPKTINTLTPFTANLPLDVRSRLHSQPTRSFSPTRHKAARQRGAELWTSIYTPLDTKLYTKLSAAHPDLPVHIVDNEYGALLQDACDDPREADVRIGRVLTSLVAIACLRAQGGAGPQLLSHVHGLRKAEDREGHVLGGGWLGTDEGCGWILESVDKIVRAFREETGQTKAKL